MPIELRELIVTAEVVDHNTVSTTARPASASIKEKEALIEECVERVFEMLNRQQQR